MTAPFTADEIMAVLPRLSPLAALELKNLLLEARLDALEGEEEDEDG